MTLAPFEFDLDAILALPEGVERDQALRAVSLVRERVESNPLWKFRPHEGELGRKLLAGEVLSGEESRGQVEYLECYPRQVFTAAVVAGNRFGKTEIGAVGALVQTLPSEFVPPWLEVYRRRPYSGDYRVRVVCVDLGNALKKVWLPKLRKLIPPAALEGGSFKNAWNDRDRQLMFADGSWWDFLTHDMDVDAFAGADLDEVLFDEEPPGEKGRQQFDESLTRLIDRDGVVRVTMTPLLGLGPIFYELTRNDLFRKDDEVYVVEGSMQDNPTLSTSMQERLRRRWEKEPLKLEARLHGRFVHFAGLIYEEFREDRHVVAPREIPRDAPGGKPSVPVYEAIDPGIGHPAGYVAAWMNPDDTLEFFHARKVADLTVEEHCALIHGVRQEHGFTPAWTVIDPAARNRNPQTGRNLQDEYRRHGVHTLLGQNSVQAGINAVKTRLKTDRLLIHASCTELIDEKRKYRWKNPKGQSEDVSRPEPIKANDDLVDPERYLVMSMPRPARPQRRDEEAALSPHDRAFRAQLRRLGKPKRVRIGSTKAA